MRRLNYRLICSFFAAGAVLLTLLLPATRPLAQRKFWLLSGSYLNQVGIDRSDYDSTTGMVSDYRIALLLQGRGQVSIEARAFELARIAVQKKEASLWGHVIRATSLVPLSTNSELQMSEIDELRRDALANLELKAATEGSKLDPSNCFFYLAQATALAKLGKWHEAILPLVRGSKQREFNDFTLDAASRQLDQLFAHVNPVLPSDLGGNWSNIFMPHLSNYHHLSTIINFAPTEKERFRVSLALAQIGKTILQTQDLPLLKYAGSAMVERSLRSTVVFSMVPQVASKVVPRIVNKAEALGLNQIASEWQLFQDWTPYRATNLTELQEAPPVDIHPMMSTHALFMLAWIGVIGAILWGASHLEHNFTNILTGTGIMLAITSLAIGLAADAWLLIGLAWGSILIFCAYCCQRLPGKKQPSVMIGVFGFLLLLVSSIISGNPAIGLICITIWSVPFAVASYKAWLVPTWLITGLVTIGLGIALAVIASGLPTTPATYEQNIVDSLKTVLLLSSFGIPIIAAYVMAFGKVNLSDCLRLVLRPIPIFAFTAACFFLWGMKQEIHLQAVWSEVSEKELPPSFKQVINAARAQNDEARKH